MKIAFTTRGTEWDSMMDPRFGRTAYILIYDEEEQTLTSYDNRAIENEAHGAGSATAQKLFELSPQIIITGNGSGKTASQALKKMDVKIFVKANDITVKQAYEHYKINKLKEI